MTGAFETLLDLWPAFVASVLVAIACALVGVHVVARRLVVVGVALPHAASFGIALSFLLHDWPVLGDHDAAALACEGAAVALLAVGARRSRLGQDALAAVLFAAAASGTILLVQRSAAGLDEIRHLVEGDVLAVHARDLTSVALTLGAVIALHVAGLRRLLLCTFDRETAATLGVRVHVWDAAFYGSLAVLVATGVHATGTLFVFGFLVVPAACALVLGRSAGGVFGTAVTTAALGAALGFLASCAWDTPTGPTCVAAVLAGLPVASVVQRLRAERSAR